MGRWRGVLQSGQFHSLTFFSCYGHLCLVCVSVVRRSPVDLLNQDKASHNVDSKRTRKGEYRKAGYVQLAFAKKPAVFVGLATPSAGPRSIQTQSNKAFPRHLRRIQSRIEKGRVRRDGVLGRVRRDGVLGRVRNSFAWNTNFLNPYLFSPIYKPKHPPTTPTPVLVSQSNRLDKLPVF